MMARSARWYPAAILMVIGVSLSMDCSCAEGAVDTHIEAAGNGRLFINDFVERYDVFASDLNELSRRMAQSAGDVGGDAEAPVYGLTESVLEVVWVLEPTPESCRVGHFYLDLDVTTILPHWSEQHHVPAAILGEWKRLSEYIDDHEARHRANSVDAANKMLQELAAMPVAATCQEARQSLHRIVSRAWYQRELKDRLLDDGSRRFSERVSGRCQKRYAKGTATSFNKWTSFSRDDFG